jgi:hypothetical protein
VVGLLQASDIVCVPHPISRLAKLIRLYLSLVHTSSYLQRTHNAHLIRNASVYSCEKNKMGFPRLNQRAVFATLSFIMVSALLQSAPLCNASEAETLLPEFFALDVRDLMARFAGAPSLEVVYRLDRVMREVDVPAQEGYVPPLRMREYTREAENALVRRIARYVLLLRHYNSGADNDGDDDYQAYADFVARLARVRLSLEMRDQDLWARVASEALERMLRYAKQVAECVSPVAECTSPKVPVPDREQLLYAKQQRAALTACADAALRAELNHPEVAAVVTEQDFVFRKN